MVSVLTGFMGTVGSDVLDHGATAHFATERINRNTKGAKIAGNLGAGTGEWAFESHAAVLR